MRDKVGELARLLHIRDANANIQTFSAGKSVGDYKVEPMMRFAVERQLEIIGEAANYLSPETKAAEAEIPWSAIKGFRNLTVHEYFGMNIRLLHRIVLEDIPPLAAAIARILQSKQNNE